MSFKNHQKLRFKSSEKTKTLQSPAARNHIPEMVSSFLSTSQGINNPLVRNAAYQGTFVDCTKIPDFRGMLDFVTKVKQDWELVPAAIRARFRNDPANFIEFLSDPKNDEEAVRLGLKVLDPEPGPTDIDILSEIRDRLPEKVIDVPEKSSTKKSGKMPEKPQS